MDLKRVGKASVSYKTGKGLKGVDRAVGSALPDSELPEQRRHRE